MRKERNDYARSALVMHARASFGRKERKGCKGAKRKDAKAK
jgi:hypothetical protein